MTIPFQVASKLNIKRKNWKWLFGIPRDLKNRALYGQSAPRYAERIWVQPAKCNGVLIISFLISRFNSGLVVSRFPPDENTCITSLDAVLKIDACLEHWLKGTPWKNTSFFREKLKIIHDRGSFKGCRTEQELVDSWAKYDQMYVAMQKEGRLKTRREMNPWSFREEGGIVAHIGPNGEWYHGNAGNRRLAMSLCLGFEKIPAMLGYVHKDGIKHLGRYRSGDTYV